MEKITQTSWTSKKISYTRHPLKILLNIEYIKYNIPLACLFDIALRQNKKRAFLFVSKVLGKHLPIEPRVLKIIGGLLARLYVETSENTYSEAIEVLVNALIELQNRTAPGNNSAYKYVNKALVILEEPIKLPQNTLFIGFAETATGIAQAVFNNFTNASYIHTTRVKFNELKPNFIFKEEHSHAVDHSIYSLKSNFLEGFEKIVLVDDELTTGNTCINLIKNLPGNSFGIITILDWRNPEQLKNFKELKELKVSSLVKGTIEAVELMDTLEEDKLIKIEEKNALPHEDIVLKENDLLEGYPKFTGRFGIDADENLLINSKIKAAGRLLKEKRLEGNCLCLGTEEFIYIPSQISAELGDNVYFHSTTKSPIYPKAEEAYCIKNKVQFLSPSDNQAVNFIYNLQPNFYKQVFLFSEKPLDNNQKTMFKNIFNTFNIKEIIFVCWN